MKKFTFIMSLVLSFGIQNANAQDPTVAAPVPEYPLSSVLSFYSGSQKYPDATTLSTLSWGQTATYDFAEAGDSECIVVKDLGWLPIGMARRQPDVLNHQYLHVDIYCNEETDFQIGFQGYGDGGAETYFPAIRYTTTGRWYGIDYPLQLMTDQGFNLGLTNVLRIGGGAGKSYASRIYLDNIFVFTGEPTNPWEESSITSNLKADLTIYPTQVRESFFVTTDEQIKNIEITNAAGQKVISIENPDENINISSVSSGLYLVKVVLENGASTTKKIIKL